MLLLHPPPREGDDDDAYTRAIYAECDKAHIMLNNLWGGAGVQADEDTVAGLFRDMAVALRDGSPVLVLATIRGLALAKKKGAHLGHGDEPKHPIIVNVCPEPEEGMCIRKLVASVLELDRDPDFEPASVVVVRTCEHCGIESKAVRGLCRGCRRAWYCGKECQLADWRAHRPACLRARRKKKPEVSDEVKLMRVVDEMVRRTEE